jgi:hypothetical protein
MIHILLSRRHAYTIQTYLESWGRDLRGRLLTTYWEDLAFGCALRPGTYIFSDIERLTEPQRELARRTWKTLSARPEAFRLLNNPDKVLRRYELLKALHAAGVNRFRAHRLNNGAVPDKFPLFVRRESEHDGSLSSLIHSREELDRAVADATRAGVPREDLLAVEYCETADPAGIYRKYSAFRVGDRIMARHLLFSNKWVLKLADITDEPQIAEETEYLRTHPHEAQLRRVYELANVDYGRIDYSMLDGQIQVWEINTNPNITSAPMKIAPARLPTQWEFIKQLKDSFDAIDRPESGDPVRLIVDSTLTRALGVTPTRRIKHLAARSVRWLAKQPFVSEAQ